MIVQIQLGNGSVEVNTLTRDGRIGILLRRHPRPHEIGEFTKTSGEEYWPENEPDDCVVWLDRLESARILQDAVNEAVLKMQGIPDATEVYLQKAEANFDNLRLLMLRQFNKARMAAGHQEETGEVCRADCSGCNDPVGSLIADRAELARENRELRSLST